MTRQYIVIEASDPEEAKKLEAHSGYMGRVANICDHCEHQSYGGPGKECNEEQQKARYNCNGFELAHSMLHYIWEQFKDNDIQD